MKAIGGPRPKGEAHIWKWNTVYPKLMEACDALPESFAAWRSLLFQNPGIEGGGTTHTLLMGIQIIRPGEVAWAHRHTSSAMYFVVRGEGATVVGEKEMAWEKHDSFVVPNWAWHEHVNRSQSEEAILFSVNDIPVMNAFGLYREEPKNSLYAVAAPPVPAARKAGAD